LKLVTFCGIPIFSLFRPSPVGQAKLQPALVGSVLALLVASLPHRSRLGSKWYLDGAPQMKLGILKLEPWFLVGGLEHEFYFPFSWE
jgi:hypothetical protein